MRNMKKEIEWKVNRELDRWMKKKKKVSEQEKTEGKSRRTEGKKWME